VKVIVKFSKEIISKNVLNSLNMIISNMFLLAKLPGYLACCYYKELRRRGYLYDRGWSIHWKCTKCRVITTEAYAWKC